MPPAKRPTRKPKTEYQRRKEAGYRMTTIEFDAPLYEGLHAQAKKEQRSATGLIRILIDEYLTAVGPTRLDPETFAQVHALAKQRRRTVAGLVKEAVTDLLEREGLAA